MKNVILALNKKKSFFHPKKIIGAIRRNGVAAPFNKAVKIMVSPTYELIFDSMYGVETSSIVPVNKLGIPLSKQKDSVRYRPTNYYTLCRALKFLNSKVDFSESTIVDFGCGKGRVLLTAAVKDIKHVIGVEISEELCNICHLQVAGYFEKKKLKGTYEIINKPAQEYEISYAANLFFFYQPFSVEIYKEVLKNIRGSYISHQREGFILEVTPRRRELFKEEGFLLVHTIDDGLGDPHSIIDIYII